MQCVTVQTYLTCGDTKSITVMAVMVLWLTSQISTKPKIGKAHLQGNCIDVYYSSQGISFNETAFSLRVIFCTQEVAKKIPFYFSAKRTTKIEEAYLH